MSGKPWRWLVINASKPVRWRDGSETYPAFAVRCRESYLAALVDYRSVISTRYVEQPVRYRIDDRAAETAIWALNREREAIGPGNQTKGEAFLSNLLGANTLTVEFTPQMGYLDFAAFNLVGHSEHIRRVADGCNKRLTSRNTGVRKDR